MTKNLTLDTILANLAQIWAPILFIGVISTSSYKLFQAIILCILKEN